MGFNFKITRDNRKNVSSEVENAILRALETAGGMAETKAKNNLTTQKARDTSNLYNSVTHVIDEKEKRVYIGSTLKDPPYGIYVEYGTGIYYAGGRRTSWVYQDAKGQWHRTNGMKARPWLKPAVEDNVKLYQSVFRSELSGL